MIDIIKPELLYKNYVENTELHTRFAEALDEAYKNKFKYANLVVGLDDLHELHDIAKYYGYSIELIEGLTERVLEAGCTRVYIKPERINEDYDKH